MRSFNQCSFPLLVQSERLAQERKVLNWEKLFSKMMVSTSDIALGRQGSTRVSYFRVLPSPPLACFLLHSLQVAITRTFHRTAPIGQNSALSDDHNHSFTTRRLCGNRNGKRRNDCNCLNQALFGAIPVIIWNSCAH